MMNTGSRQILVWSVSALAAWVASGCNGKTGSQDNSSSAGSSGANAGGSGSGAAGATGAAGAAGAAANLAGRSGSSGSAGTGGTAVTGAGGSIGGADGGATVDAGTGGRGDAGGGAVDAAAPDARPAACTGLPKLKLTTIVPAMASPLALAQPAGDTRLYIVERRGRIRIVKDGMVLARPFLDLSASTTSDGSRGFFGLAFHPKYADNGRFFVHYTRSADDPVTPGLQLGDIVIAEGKRSGGDPELAEPMLKVVVPIALVRTGGAVGDHHGGQLAFGPDGFLFAGIGDGGGQKDPHKNGQNPMNKLGKILRIDVDNPTARVAGNLANADPHVWSYGVRNPWRFSFDRVTGDLYIGDVGQDDVEEIDFVPSGGAGRNFGWSVTEGSPCFPASAACDKTGKTAPLWEYDHTVGKSVTGGYVYRGQKMPCLQGRYVFGDYNRNRVFSFVVRDSKVADQVELTSDLNEAPIGGLVSFGEDAAGELYILNLSIAGGMGRVYRIDPE